MEGHSTPLAPATGDAAVRWKLSAKLRAPYGWARRLVLPVEKQFSVISIFVHRTDLSLQAPAMSDTKIPTTDKSSNLILIAGATGYVGGRLLHALESSGHRVRCLARHPESLRERVAETTEVVQGDVLEPASLPAAMEGIHVAYYLVHAMASANSFEEEDRKAAESFAAAARDAKVARIVYLGGLGAGDSLSAHLRSRQEVGRIFRESGVTAIEFRTSIIVGSGSVSFEIVRALVEKLPVMDYTEMGQDAHSADSD
jgi:NAD(P)H-binding